MMLGRRGLRAAVLMTIGAVAACDDDPTGPNPGDEVDYGELTVDAAEDWAFVRLGDPAEVTEIGDPETSTAWDLGFFATSVMLNGGDAGPADVDGHCLCGNEDLSDEEITQLTDEDAIASFEAVAVSDVPADEEAWQGDGLVPAIGGWYSYDFTTHTVSADPSAVFKVRTADGEAFAKLHVTSIEGATQQHAGTVTLEFAFQPAAGEPFGETQVLEVDVSGGAVPVDLASGAAVEEGASWDIELSGYTIRVNGGVSGDGSGGAVLVEEPFEEIADAGDMTAGHYRGDAFGGVFASEEAGRRWYRYNLEGNHQIWPTQNVYLVRRGSDVYKVQIAGYYDPDTGDDRQVTFRYQRLDP